MLLRKIFRWCLLPKLMPGLLAAVTGFDRWKLEGHRQALKKKLTKEQWISMNTDGPFCPLAQVYNRMEAALLFKDFANVRQEVGNLMSSIGQSSTLSCRLRGAMDWPPMGLAPNGLCQKAVSGLCRPLLNEQHYVSNHGEIRVKTPAKSQSSKTGYRGPWPTSSCGWVLW